MALNYKFSKRIGNDFSGHQSLAELYHQAKDLFLDDLIVDFSDTTWFEANLSAVLGAILTTTRDEANNIQIENIPSNIETIFRKNKFLSHFGGRDAFDSNSTTIPYAKFDLHEVKHFEKYLETELFSKTDLPTMSKGLTKKMKESLLEIFINAKTHASCVSIFSCGQYFPQKHKIDFTIVDIGKTIQNNVSDFLNTPKITSLESINWAIMENHTTRKGSVPGGLGLSTMLSFIELNKGKVQIISGDGYWSKTPMGIVQQVLDHHFGGTVVNIEFNTNDQNSYILSTESSQTNIF